MEPAAGDGVEAPALLAAFPVIIWAMAATVEEAGALADFEADTADFGADWPGLGRPPADPADTPSFSRVFFWKRDRYGHYQVLK